MGANPHANGGLLLRDLRMPDFRDYAVDVPTREQLGTATRVLGRFLRDVMTLNRSSGISASSVRTRRYRTAWRPLFEATDRQWDAATQPNDEFLAPDGRVMEVLSEHQCQGWLEGYLLTGRHGLSLLRGVHPHHRFDVQPARQVAEGNARPPVAAKIASLNYLLASHVWRQDHNGFTHQDPGFIDHVVNKKAEIVRVYLPPDANCLLSVMDHCLRSRHYVNVVIAGKHPAPQWLIMDAAVTHCTEGIGIWEWASNDRARARRSHGVLRRRADAGNAGRRSILREHLPELKIRVVNVVDLMGCSRERTPHGLTEWISMRSSPRTSRSSSPSTATHG